MDDSLLLKACAMKNIKDGLKLISTIDCMVIALSAVGTLGVAPGL